MSAERLAVGDRVRCPKMPTLALGGPGVERERDGLCGADAVCPVLGLQIRCVVRRRRSRLPTSVDRAFSPGHTRFLGVPFVR